MWNTATISEILHDANDYGFQIPADKIEFSWPKIKLARDNYIARLNVAYGNSLNNSKVEVFKGKGEFIGKNKIKVGEEVVLSGEHVLIATGGRPSVPSNIPGAHLGIDSLLFILFIIIIIFIIILFFIHFLFFIDFIYLFD